MVGSLGGGRQLPLFPSRRFWAMTEQELDPTPFLDCWFLTGPTASGKTATGIALAQLIDAEIVVMDSMTVYREMNVGTAKPTAQQVEEVRHHLLDLVSPTEEFSISEYLQAAARAVDDIRSRGKQVLFVGGTPLYLRALLRGIDQGPPPDPAFRAEVMEEVEQYGSQALHDRLALVDPLAASRIHPHDTKRLIRALEVFHATGLPISHRQRHFDQPPLELPRHAFALQWPRGILHERINARVQEMFERGFVDEVRRLIDKYGRLSKTASQAVGYREVLAHLIENVPLEETIRAVQTRTRRFARRQETWFRSFEELRPVSAVEASAQQLAERLAGNALR